jgi:hypothetical protein
MQIDWGELATELEAGNLQGTQLSLDAIEILLGEDISIHHTFVSQAGI